MKHFKKEYSGGGRWDFCVYNLRAQNEYLFDGANGSILNQIS